MKTLSRDNDRIGSNWCHLVSRDIARQDFHCLCNLTFSRRYLNVGLKHEAVALRVVVHQLEEVVALAVPPHVDRLCQHFDDVRVVSEDEN
jgi:hypothetical protein